MKCRQIYRNIPYMEHLGVDGYFKVAMQIRGDPWKAGLSLSDFFWEKMTEITTRKTKMTIKNSTI